MLISKLRAALVLVLIGSAWGAVCPTGSALIANCATCSTLNNNVVCSTCIVGYYLSSNACTLCSSAIANCYQCTVNTANQPTCNICQASFGLLNALCATCSAIVGCTSCRIANYNLQCTACNVGLVLYSALMQCVPCQIPNCSLCSVTNQGNFTCAACALGYYLASNACLPCSLKVTYCSTCQLDANSRVICLQCASTHLYLSNNTCLANCSKGGYPRCSICQLVSLATNAMTCSACIPNYYLDAGSLTCQLCSDTITGCTSCMSKAAISGNSTVNTVQCSACSSNYFLSSPTACVLCSSVKTNCKTCSFNFSANTGQCLTCAPAYYLSSTDFACYPCTVGAVNTCASCGMNGTALVCTACQASYYLLNGACTTCTQSIQNCSSCSYSESGFVCLSCLSGSILDSAKKCSPCSLVYPFCNYCNAVECTDCQVGYYTINNKACLVNCAVNNCNQCAVKNNSKCSLCSQGYSLTAQFTCAMIGCTAPLTFNGVACVCPHQSYYVQAGNTCQPCSDPSCELCPSNKCTKCLDGFFEINNSTCTKCASNCQYCNSSKTCLRCVQGYYSYGGGCQGYNEQVVGNMGIIMVNNLYTLCGMGCIQCSITSCLSCEQGYYLNGSTCILCPSNCKICDLTFTTTSTTVSVFNTTTNRSEDVIVNSTKSSTICLVCQSGLALVNLVCSACTDPNCVRCDNNVFFCLLCSITYTADPYGICKPCAAYCNFCDVEGGGTCDDDSCFLGYAKFNKTTCIRCLNGCSSCNPTYPFACIGCLLGSYPVQSASGECANCDLGCTACTGPSACTSCAFNYNLLSGNCLLACVLPCVMCSFLNNRQICTTCLQGYSLSNGSCVGDFSCMSTNICEFCPLGYFAYRGSCYACSAHCDSCLFTPNDPSFTILGQNYLSFESCSQCSASYYLDTNMDCQQCPSNCLSCSAYTSCNKCNSTYFLQYKLVNGVGNLNYSVGICLKCSPACYECQSEPNRCVSCKPGFRLTGFVCSSLTNVTFSFTLVDSSNNSKSNMFTNIVNNIADLYLHIGSILGSAYSNNHHLFMITSIRNGSVVVSGQASIDPNSNDPSNAYNSMAANVGQTSTVSGYQVGSYSLVPNGFTPTSPTTTTATDYTLYIIIGAAVFALAVIALVVFLCMRCRRRKGGEEGESARMEKLQTENQQPATSKNMLKSEDIYPKSSALPQRVSKRTKTDKVQVSHISGNKTVIAQKDENIKEVQGKAEKSNRVSRRQLSQREKGENVQHSKHSKERKVSRLPDKTVYRQEDRKELQEISKRKSKEEIGVEQASRGKSRDKSKSAKQLPESFAHLQTLNYKSSRNIDVPKESLEERQVREIERLRNESYFDEGKTEKVVKESKRTQSKGRSNSIEHKYIPNKNTHFI